MADILSRYPEDMAEEEPPDNDFEYQINYVTMKMNKDVCATIKDMGKHQEKDKKLERIISNLRNSDDNNMCRFYKYVDDKLYRKSKGKWKLYVPASIRNGIIAEIHKMYGHAGSKKCTKLIQEYFTFNQMSKQIKEYIKMCDKCQRCKDTNNRNLFGGTKPILPTTKGKLVSGDYYCLLYTSN